MLHIVLMFVDRVIKVLFLVGLMSTALSFFAWQPAYFPIYSYSAVFHISETYLYRQFFFFGLVVLLGLFLFRKHIRRGMLAFLERAALQNQQRLARRLVGFGVFLYTIYMLKLHVGFLHAGVPNWHYQHLRDPEPITERTAFPEELFAGFKTPNQEIPTPYEISGFVYLLHYSDSVLPFNLEVLGLTVPHELFDNPEGLRSILQVRLEEFKNNKAFILPRNWSYGQHVIFQSIDYSNYPDFSELQGVSTWEVGAIVHPNRIEGLRAEKLKEIRFN